MFISSVMNFCSVFSGTVLPVILFASGIYLLFRLGKYVYDPKTPLKFLLRKRTPKTGEKETSPFASLCLALAGTLGVGNITGVASAILTAGPGTVFWMWVCALVSAILKYSETVLALKYRKKDADGNYLGGAFYYLRDGLGAKAAAVFFAFLCVLTSFTLGNMTQSRAASDGLYLSFGLSPYVTGIFLFAAVLVLSLGGGKIISAFTLRLVPVLCGAYAFLCVFIIIINRDRLGSVTALIVSEAFTPEAGAGGVMGFLFSPALRYGITRGITSSEAGCGTAPIAHASAKTENPVRQGLLGITEVFCDTLLLCTLTAYVILLSGALPENNATEFAIDCFSYFSGGIAGTFLGVSMFLFALASIASWAFYGQSALRFLGGGKKVLAFYGTIFSFFAFLGCVLPENGLWTLSDISVSLMATVNTLAVLLLSGKVIKETQKFCGDKPKPGKN